MRPIAKAIAVAVLACGAALTAASAAEKSPATADPGEEIKEGVIKFGHGVRDGAVRAWGAVKSAVGGATNTPDKRQAPPPKDPSAGSK